MTGNATGDLLSTMRRLLFRWPSEPPTCMRSAGPEVRSPPSDTLKGWARSRVASGLPRPSAASFSASQVYLPELRKQHEAPPTVRERQTSRLWPLGSPLHSRWAAASRSRHVRQQDRSHPLPGHDASSDTEGTWLDPRVSGETLESYARAWIAQRQGPRGPPLAERTRETYLNSLDRHNAPRIGHLPLAKVSPSIVRTWHSDLVATGKPTAARQSYALLRAVMTTAVDDGALHRNPVPDCRGRAA